jgi:MFS family permease
MADSSLRSDGFEQTDPNNTVVEEATVPESPSPELSGTDTSDDPDVSNAEQPSSLATEQVYAPVVVASRNVLFRILITVAGMVTGLSSIVIKQLLLPIQIGQIDPGTATTTLALVSSFGAITALIAAPVAGAFSDRTAWRWGHRRPWLVFGLISTVVGMVMMALSRTLPPLILGEILAQLGVNAILAPLTALIPDQVPTSQRAFTSALVGMAPNVGGTVGLLLVTGLTDTRVPTQGYLLMAGMTMICICAFLLVLREKSLDREHLPPFNLKLFLIGFLRPLQSVNFVYILTSRVLSFLSFFTVSTFLLYSLESRMHMVVPLAARGVTIYQVLSNAILFILALLTGSIVAKIQRLKLFAICGALLMAGGLFVLAFFPIWSGLLAAAVIFGVGYGLYLGVDINIAVCLLPHSTESGKDLGLLYTATYLSLLLSPIIGAVVLAFSHSYTLLFAVAAISSVLAAAFIVPIKFVRTPSQAD